MISLASSGSSSAISRLSTGTVSLIWISASIIEVSYIGLVGPHQRLDPALCWPSRTSYIVIDITGGSVPLSSCSSRHRTVGEDGQWPR